MSAMKSLKSLFLINLHTISVVPSTPLVCNALFNQAMKKEVSVKERSVYNFKPREKSDEIVNKKLNLARFV